MSIVRISVILSFFFVGSLASSCCKKKIYCKTAYVDFALTGFPRSEARTFVLKRLAVGAEWDDILDEATFVYNGGRPVSSIKDDTLYFSEFTTTGDIRQITPGNDWIIYMPATNKILFIDDIAESDNRSELVRCGDHESGCAKYLHGFALNDRWQVGGFVYIENGKF